MKIRILGGGWYGCHLALAMLNSGHDVVLQEKAPRLFAGASGANPARLHLGMHYPRSRITRALCQSHFAAFMEEYGFLTRAVPINIYAIAAHDSLVDWGTYKDVLRGDVEFVSIHRPADFGLFNVEGAMLTGERHIVIDQARGYFSERLLSVVDYNVRGDRPNSDESFDWTFDCTFCASDSQGIDRFEPCITTLLEGPTDKAVTIMDGPFPSIYPWNENDHLNSLTSAKFTPLAKCATYAEAQAIIDGMSVDQMLERTKAMVEQMWQFWPESRDIYRPVRSVLSIRAQPRSGSDARLVDVVKISERRLRVRAGKIDAILTAEQHIREMIDV